MINNLSSYKGKLLRMKRISRCYFCKEVCQIKVKDTQLHNKVCFTVSENGPGGSSPYHTPHYKTLNTDCTRNTNTGKHDQDMKSPRAMRGICADWGWSALWYLMLKFPVGPGEKTLRRSNIAEVRSILEISEQPPNNHATATGRLTRQNPHSGRNHFQKNAEWNVSSHILSLYWEHKQGMYDHSLHVKNNGCKLSPQIIFSAEG